MVRINNLAITPSDTEGRKYNDVYSQGEDNNNNAQSLY